MPPIMSKPSRAAHMAIIYVTVGALLMVWCAVWYAWMLHQPAPDGGQPNKDGWFYVCYAIFFTGLTLFIIGFALGRIGRAGRRAELPPEVSTTYTAQPAVTSQPIVQSAAPGLAVAGQPVIPGQPAAVQQTAPVAGVAPTAPIRKQAKATPNGDAANEIARGAPASVFMFPAFYSRSHKPRCRVDPVH